MTRKTRQNARLIATIAMLGLIAWLRPTDDGHRQLPLNSRTLARAESLRQALHNPMTAVKTSERYLSELARIPDPKSFATWRDVLLTPRAFPSPVRKMAARTIAEYRGASDEMTTQLLAEALGRETVREVLGEIGQTLHAKAGAQPQYLARRSASHPARVKIFE